MKSNRFENTYYDKDGKQILVGDLLRVDHFKNGNKMHYMYHVPVMEDTKDGQVMSLRSYYGVKPHVRMFVVSDELGWIYNAKIISTLDFQTRRKLIKINKS
jgi:hypothetical protein